MAKTDLTPEQQAEADRVAAEKAADKALEEKIHAAVDSKLGKAVADATAPLLEKIEALEKSQPANASSLSTTVEKRKAFEPIIVKNVELEVGGKKSKSDYIIGVPSVKIEGVLYTAEELSKNAEVLAKLIKGGSSHVKQYFGTK